ncbi:hypothetical protein TcG_12021 [Trypanosoma cruzi]|nr:hypothetical protein TcG_12021 [Trypanosoma cruzi]
MRCTTATRQSHRARPPTHLHSLEVRRGDSCKASFGPRASSKDASVHLEANPAPLRRIIAFRTPTQHERLTRLRCIEEVRGAAPLGKYALVNTLEGSDGHFSAGRCRSRGTSTRPQPNEDLPVPHPRPSC